MTVPFSSQWRILHNVLVPKHAGGGRVRDKAWLAKTQQLGGTVESSGITPASSTSFVYGQDSVTAGNTGNGYTFYAGYVTGYVSYGAMVARHPSSKVLSITTRAGVYGCNVIDVEPGCCSFSDAIPFMQRSTHPGMAKPIIYCAAWQGQEMINFLASYGYSRNSYTLWLAHYGRGLHMCSPGACGYASADMTQYASNSWVDSDVAYAYVFSGSTGGGGGNVPTNYPVSEGATGPLVKALQNGLNKWNSRIVLGTPLTPDGSFGAATKAAVIKAQVYFGEHGVAAGTATQWLMDQLAFDLWPLKQGLLGMDIENLEERLNIWAPYTGSARQNADGEFGPGVAGAVTKAQEFFGEHGVAAGECSQWMWGNLSKAPFPMTQGYVGKNVETLQANLNKWHVVLGSPVLSVDGIYGAQVAVAVTKAQEHFNEHGIPAGECTQALFAKLEVNP